MITFNELRAILEDYNPETKFVIFRTDSRAPLGTAVGYEAAKQKAEEFKTKNNAYLSKVKSINSDYKAALAKANKDLATALGSTDTAAKAEARTIHEAALAAAKKAKEDAEKLLGPKPVKPESIK